MLNNRLPDLLKKQMTRKEFINLCAVFVVSMFGIVGAIETLVSRATGPEASEEAANGNLANGAQLKTDPTASNGEAVVFGQATTTPPPGNYQPTINGLTGNWTLAFDDEFDGVNSDGTGLDTSKWAYGNFGHVMNNVANLPASNVAVSGGNLILTLSDENTGAMITTCDSSGSPWSANILNVGDICEARVYFPGDTTGNSPNNPTGSPAVYNWPAWWASGQNWPTNGENDIAEAGGNYIRPCYLWGPQPDVVTTNEPQPDPGTFFGDWHVYTLWRQSGTSYLYYDGVKISSIPTSDYGGGQALCFNVGTNGNSNSIVVTGSDSQVLVDYCRLWTPA